MYVRFVVSQVIVIILSLGSNVIQLEEPSEEEDVGGLVSEEDSDSDDEAWTKPPNVTYNAKTNAANIATGVISDFNINEIILT